MADKTKRRKLVSIKYKLSTHICLSEYCKLQFYRKYLRKISFKNYTISICTSGLAKYKSEKRVSSKIQLSRARIGLGRSQIENRQRPRVLLVRESGFTQELSIFFSLFYIFFSLYHILLLFISHCLQKVSRQYNWGYPHVFLFFLNINPGKSKYPENELMFQATSGPQEVWGLLEFGPRGSTLSHRWLLLTFLWRPLHSNSLNLLVILKYRKFDFQQAINHIQSKDSLSAEDPFLFSVRYWKVEKEIDAFRLRKLTASLGEHKTTLSSSSSP